MGILLVYDCTDESSFNNIRNWIRNIETHAADSVNKVWAISCDILCEIGVCFSASVFAVCISGIFLVCLFLGRCQFSFFLFHLLGDLIPMITIKVSDSLRFNCENNTFYIILRSLFAASYSFLHSFLSVLLSVLLFSRFSCLYLKPDSSLSCCTISCSPARLILPYLCIPICFPLCFPLCSPFCCPPSAQVLIGNKCDMNTEKAVDTARGQALADEYGMKFFEVRALSFFSWVSVCGTVEMAQHASFFISSCTTHLGSRTKSTKEDSPGPCFR
jgi:hypothetical protein